MVSIHVTNARCDSCGCNFPSTSFTSPSLPPPLPPFSRNHHHHHRTTNNNYNDHHNKKIITNKNKTEVNNKAGKRRKISQRKEKKKNSTKNKITNPSSEDISQLQEKLKFHHIQHFENHITFNPTSPNFKRRFTFIYLPIIKDNQNLLVFVKFICFPNSSPCFIILIRLNYTRK
ncbi:conserved hypothetical protein [Candida dubliniensis CD36]|uniref:Uncharacterized protein n=1 Tax=Candida dubliniensis (strain CD36 / ATCC MYA-646 / CBS 7987 / NCPF 3949 / NRRL Y-17841) TaxID=573826 RepID=B9WCJ3_CANDC|nr:conserved hypothetical protein [Candida dubliniensis CD36]CAX44116.1 conserved hypothetical protein [Candida dubliniensis CD36]